MTVLVVTLTGGWTLASDGDDYTLDRRQVCVDGTCARVEQVRIRDDGVWTVGDVEVRWDSATTARMGRGAGPWTPAVLRSPVAAASPWEGTPGERLTAGWGHGVLPGFWQSATYHCEEGTQAWLFRPIVKTEPELGVRKTADGWAFSEGAEVVECPGDVGGIWERKRE
jgi:hypothetical protein